MNELARQEEKRLAERGMVHALEDLLNEQEDKIDVDEITQHFFSEGVYARMLFLPKGTVAVGKIHKTDHLNIICSGKVSVLTEDGPIVIEGPCVFNARKGVKKAAYALEDTTWINIHVTDKTDLDEIEEDFIAKDYDEIEFQEE